MCLLWIYSPSHGWDLFFHPWDIKTFMINISAIHFKSSFPWKIVWSSSFSAVISHVPPCSLTICFISDGGLRLQLQRSVTHTGSSQPGDWISPNALKHRVALRSLFPILNHAQNFLFLHFLPQPRHYTLSVSILVFFFHQTSTDTSSFIHPQPGNHTTDPEHHTLSSLPPISLEKEGGIRGQSSVGGQQEMVVLLGTGSWPRHPSTFHFFVPSHAWSSTTLASLLLIQLHAGLFPPSCFPTHCHVKQRSVCFTVTSESCRLNSGLLQSLLGTNKKICLFSFINSNLKVS